MRYVGGTVTPDQTAVQIERMNERWERDGFGSLLAERTEDGRIIGRFGVFIWDIESWDPTGDLTQPHEVEIGWLLGLAFRGHGYATEAAAALRSWAWETLAPPRLVSIVNVDNAASAAVARRLGCSAERRVQSTLFGLCDLWVHPR